MALTLDTVNSISLSKQAHTRRPELMGSNHCYHLKSRPTTSRLTVPLHFTGLASQNSTMTAPFQWLLEDEDRLFISGDTILNLPVMYTSPPPAAPTYPPPAIPELTILIRSIIQSSDQLFFISHSIRSNEAHKWCLVQVVFKESMSSYPLCLQDGRFLLNFFICHPSDSHLNAINQYYWLQYHTLSNLQSPLTTIDTHLICPSDTLVNYA